mmetsp:Transcript_19740/g.46266  ORF Transcript_19740/g.46266 Transcript_19740/m.46266 type:complete len:118 (-) Transcript_19740:52-405(-)
MYDPLSDLPVPDGIVHTVPICEEGTCVAICQFLCPELEGTMLTDDGCFHAENPEHAWLLRLVLTFVERHLCILATKTDSSDGDVDEIIEADDGSSYEDDVYDEDETDWQEWGDDEEP